MRIDWKNVISVDMEYPDKARAKDILYVEYKDGRLEKVVYPRGIPSDELVEMLNLADEKKIDLKETIKTLGVHNVDVKLYEGVYGVIKVDVRG